MTYAAVALVLYVQALDSANFLWTRSQRLSFHIEYK